MNLCDNEAIRALLARHGFHFSKSMGQNFLIDPNIPRAIAEVSGADERCAALEIGPGIGPLTAELARRCGRVVAIELDRSLLPVLQETLSDFSNVEILSGDGLKMDLAALVQERFGGLRPLVCSNLPYNITTPMLTKLAQTPAFTSVTVLIQREVARRICAAPGNRECGYISLFLQYYFETRMLFDVPPESFYPVPKVTSSLLHCMRRERPPVAVADESFFFRVMSGAFLLRRKTLVNSLSSALGSTYPKEAIQSAVCSCGLPGDVRGERLSLQNVADLAAALQKLQK